MTNQNFESSNSEINLNWWEKTVEYLFIRNILPEENISSPFSGTAEKFFGDLFDENESGARLIEFKRNEETIEDEVFKYFPKGQTPKNTTYSKEWGNIDDIEKYLGSKGHWLVYGHPSDKTLVLMGRQYGVEDASSFKITTDTDIGYVTPSLLLEYMKVLGEKRIRGGSWSSSIVIASVAGKKRVLSAEQFMNKCLDLEFEDRITKVPAP